MAPPKRKSGGRITPKGTRPGQSASVAAPATSSSVGQSSRYTPPIPKAVKESPRWVPVLMLSAKDGEYDQADGLDAGADDYLTKPFSFVVLLARLRALLRRGAPERPAVLVAGTLQLDPATRQVRRDTDEITLTAREYALLEYLMRRRDEVVTKTELLDHVWDAGADTDPNVVEVYVGYLRRKIDHPYGLRSLQTVRGAGYRLVG